MDVNRHLNSIALVVSVHLLIALPDREFLS